MALKSKNNPVVYTHKKKMIEPKKYFILITEYKEVIFKIQQID